MRLDSPAGVGISRMQDGIGNFNPFTIAPSTGMAASAVENEEIEATACDSTGWARLLSGPAPESLTGEAVPEGEEEGRHISAVCWAAGHSLMASARDGVHILRLRGTSGRGERPAAVALRQFRFPSKQGSVQVYGALGIWPARFLKLERNTLNCLIQKALSLSLCRVASSTAHLSHPRSVAP